MDAPDWDLLLDGVRGVSFDFDGTLAEVGRRKLAMWPAILRHPRIMGAYSPVISGLRGARHRDLIKEIARRVAAEVGGAPERVAEVLAAEIDGRWPALFADAQVAPPVAELLTAVDERALPRVVVSDYPALSKLEGMGLSGWTAVIDCRALGAFKPHPDGLLVAAATLGITAASLLHVGDRWDTDGGAASAAGTRFLHVAQIPR